MLLQDATMLSGGVERKAVMRWETLHLLTKVSLAVGENSSLRTLV